MQNCIASVLQIFLLDQLQVTNSAIVVAGKLLDQTEKPVALSKPLTQEELTQGVEFESTRNSKSEQ